MPGTEFYPFRRLAVDHMIVGTSRIWWEMHRDFLDPEPHIFQLQVGNTGLPNATDWQDVGTPVINGYFALDDEQREGNYGKRLITHYRVKLTTSKGLYVSMPVSTYGELNEKDWVFAREIVRKEGLRHDLVSREGYLLKRRRFGESCTRCLDPLTGEITDSNCPECGGTGFQSGWHPPVPLRLDMSPEVIVELRKATEPPGPSRPTDLKGRIRGFPQVNKEDVWIDAKSDQRWYLHEVYHMAEWRGVPLVVQVGMRLAPYTDYVYKIEIGGEDAEFNTSDLPTTGNGDVRVDHDYCEPDYLQYTDAEGCGIVGATILAFTKEDYDAGIRSSERAVATSSTTANGRWAFAMLLCQCVDYVLVFEKTGCYGPDTIEITPTPECQSSICSEVSSVSSEISSESSQISSSSSFWSV